MIVKEMLLGPCSQSFEMMNRYDYGGKILANALYFRYIEVLRILKKLRNQ